ncbi:MAG: hypothetical protein WBX30_26930, partial [Stellaceae bacterium]
MQFDSKSVSLEDRNKHRPFGVETDNDAIGVTQPRISDMFVGCLNYLPAALGALCLLAVTGLPTFA